MKGYILILLITICLGLKSSYSQSIRKADSLTRAKVVSLISKIRKSYIGDNDYVLFSISERWYLIIVKDDLGFHEYYLNPEVSGNQIKGMKFVKKARILMKMFDLNYYQKDYITFDSSFFKYKQVYSEGNITYFYLMENGIKYGEARLSVKINPNPIKEKIYNYLTTELLLFMAKNAPNDL